MWIYEKKLEHPVRVSCPDLKFAKMVITQYGGPDFILTYLQTEQKENLEGSPLLMFLYYFQVSGCGTLVMLPCLRML